jgi:competence protein ComEC
MLALTLAAFVAGVFLLQQQAELPALPALAAIGLTALASAGAALWVAPRGDLGGLRLLAVRAAVIGAALGFGFIHAAMWAHARIADELAAADEGRDLRLVGVVAGLPAQLARGQRFEFVVEAVRTPAARVPARIAIAWYASDAVVRPGERWAFTARLRRPHGSANPGGFDLEAWMLERSLRATGYVRTGRLDEAPQRLASFVAAPGAAIDRARHQLRERLQQRLQGARYGGVLVALVLGDQRAIGADDWLLFSRTGITHLVSISGLHITMIAALVAALVGIGWRRSPALLRLAPAQSAAAVAAVIAAFLYCLLAGWGVPAQRTFFMLGTVAVALLARAPLGAATTLALAAAVVCLLDPWAVIAPGFWLSFGAVAAIFWIVSGRSPAAAPAWSRRLRAAAAVQLAVTVALVPLTIVLFRYVALASPLANAIAIPVVSLLVTPLALLGGVFVVLPAPLSSVAVPLLEIAHWAFGLLATVLAWLVQSPWATVAAPAPAWWTVPLAMFGIFWLLAPRGWPLRGLGAIWLLPLVAWSAPRPAPGDLWVTALDVGQGMAVVVETRDHVLLYDTGPRYSPEADAGSRVILPYLRWRGIGAVDLLVVSHLDSDHSGGAASILRALPVGAVWTSIAPELPALRDLGDPTRRARCEAGQSLRLGAATVRVVHPPAAAYLQSGMSTNAMSCVVEVVAGTHRVLLTGDIPAREESALVRRESGLATTVLTAPHHGSRHSSSAAFVAATRPAWVVYQAGYRNRFGHPDPAVVERYRLAGAREMRTDRSGAVQWRLGADGSIAVDAWRDLAARYWHNRPDRSAASTEPEQADDTIEAREPGDEPVPAF